MGVADVSVGVVFSGLSLLIVGGVIVEEDRLVVQAWTPHRPVGCPGCGVGSSCLHGYHRRVVTDVALGGGPVQVRVRIRRLVCSTPDCCKTFREQVPGVPERCRRRTIRLTGRLRVVVRELAGRAGTRLSAAFRIRISRHTALRTLLRIPLPHRMVPAVIGVDDFALRRRHRWGTVVIDPVTHERIDVLEDRKADILAGWLTDHPQVQAVVRDGLHHLRRGRAPCAAGCTAGRRPMAPVARAGAGGREGGRGS